MSSGGHTGTKGRIYSSVLVSEVSRKPRIVCLGRDTELLTVRLYVLATAFDAFRADSLEELATFVENPSFCVVVLCHTLFPEECNASVELVRHRWLKAKVLLLSTGLSDTAYKC